MRTRAMLAVLTVAATGVLVLPSIASAGVETGFATGGRLAVVEVETLAIAVRENGNVVAVGVDPVAERTFRIVELQADGSPRPGFGSSGTVKVAVPGATGSPEDPNRIFEPRGVDVTADGGLLVQFRTASGNAVARVRADGTPDPSFAGGSGYRNEAFTSCGLPTDMVVSPLDGSLTSIARDFGNVDPACKGTALRRYAANGTKIDGWGGTAVAGARIEARLLGVAGAADAAGNLYVSGRTFDERAAVVKLTPTGQPAVGFGLGGIVTFDPMAGQAYEYMGNEGGFPSTLSNKTATDVALDGAGRVLLIGSTRVADSGSLEVWVVRLLPDGTLDPSFGTAGMALVDVAGGGDDLALQVAVDGQGRPVVTGSTRPSTPRPSPVTMITTPSTAPRQQFVLRLTAGGERDTGADTIVTQYGQTTTAYVPTDLALGADGRAYTSGSYVDPFGSYYGFVGAAGLDRPPPATSLFTGVLPVRALDTRISSGAGALGAGVTRTVNVTGIGGAGGIPSTGVAAVAVNVTAVAPSTDGHVTVWPEGNARPTASALNVSAGRTIANSLIVGVGTSGGISLQLSAGSAHVVVDVMGWFAAGKGFVPVIPWRAVDTRLAPLVVLAPGETREVTVTGNGVPTDAEAAAVNVTAIGGTAIGHFRAWRAGGPVPASSVLNFAPGQTIANAMVLGTGSGGRIAIRNYSAAPVHLVVDVMGYFAAGSELNPIAPVRVMDTRETLGGAALGGGAVRLLQVTGIGAVPAAGVRAVVVNITVTNPTQQAYLTVWPAGSPVPTASVLNYTPGATIANAFVVGVDSNGRIALSNSFGTSDLLVDVLGWF